MAGNTTLLTQTDLGGLNPEIFTDIAQLHDAEQVYASHFQWQSQSGECTPMGSTSQATIESILTIAAPLFAKTVEWAGNHRFQASIFTHRLAPAETRLPSATKWHTDGRDQSNTRRMVIAFNDLPTMFVTGSVPRVHPVVRAQRERRNPHEAVEKALASGDIAPSMSESFHATGLTYNTLHRAQWNNTSRPIRRVFIRVGVTS